MSVLAGALVVGDSVRGSLRDLALGRLGSTDLVVARLGFLPRERLPTIVRTDSGGHGAAPLIVADGFVTLESSGRRASDVLVYGVDERFWTFHGAAARRRRLRVAGAGGGSRREGRRRAADAPAAPSEIPVESLFGRKEEVGRTVRLTLTACCRANGSESSR